MGSIAERCSSEVPSPRCAPRSRAGARTCRPKDLASESPRMRGWVGIFTRAPLPQAASSLTPGIHPQPTVQQLHAARASGSSAMRSWCWSREFSELVHPPSHVQSSVTSRFAPARLAEVATSRTGTLASNFQGAVDAGQAAGTTRQHPLEPTLSHCYVASHTSAMVPEYPVSRRHQFALLELLQLKKRIWQRNLE